MIQGLEISVIERFYKKAYENLAKDKASDKQLSKSIDEFAISVLDKLKN